MSDTPDGNRRGPATVAVVGVAVLLVALVAGGAGGAASPLDPASTKPDGTRALVLLLQGLGGDVRVSQAVPITTGGTVLVLHDFLSPEARTQLRSWVDGGGTLVVADPNSELSGAAPFRESSQLVTGAGVSGLLDRRCAEPALQTVDRLDPSGGVLFRPEAGETACFTEGGGAFVLVRRQGSGTVVAIGGAGMFVNANLGKADNSVLASSLLAPTAGVTVTLLGGGGQVGGGRKHLLDLVVPRLKEAFWQLVVAFGLVVLWRSRRHGRPVLEAVPVEVPGSELVVAVGHLLQQAGRKDQAARILREQLRRHLADRLGLPAMASPTVVAEAAAARTSIAKDRVLAALTGPPPAGEAELVALAQSTETISQEVSHAR